MERETKLAAKTIFGELTKVLEPESFVRKRNLFVRDWSEAILWVELQKSRDATHDCFRFTINLGAFLPALAEAVGEPIREIEIFNGHWQLRLGELLPSPEDRWWEARNADDAMEIGRQVAGLLKEYGLPALRQAGSISGLMGFFETGQGIMYIGPPKEKLLSALKQLAATEKEAKRG